MRADSTSTRAARILATMAEVAINAATRDSETCVISCLDAVLRQPLRDIEITIVDNASRDGPVPLIQDHYGARVRLIRISSNEGYR